MKYNKINEEKLVKIFQLNNKEFENIRYIDEAKEDDTKSTTLTSLWDNLDTLNFKEVVTGDDEIISAMDVSIDEGELFFVDRQKDMLIQPRHKEFIKLCLRRLLTEEEIKNRGNEKQFLADGTWHIAIDTGIDKEFIKRLMIEHINVNVVEYYHLDMETKQKDMNIFNGFQRQVGEIWISKEDAEKHNFTIIE